MRSTFDFAPLFRSSVGFDHLLNALEASSRPEAVDSWPPYDILRSGKDEYRITMAVAGFSPEDVTLTQEPNILVVAGQKADEVQGQYLHRGIAQRSFQRRFELADHVKVTSANLVDGLLTIDLVREIPEAMKPRRIQIASDPALAKTEDPRQIESDQHAA
ncbi:Hsp20 family protein [Rubellimicrobium roseum]|uniref:Hsp20 family protein n=1 Tax=Rubellimicrobium roseum TaxID=687525 RepID=A0A5C4N825_9RHOB|nr:Hsp20 family protein [Rubellimicrobium roseum]TNC60305.1 Hsp20 family protein [Rubellimicrobium roseum]